MPSPAETIRCRSFLDDVAVGIAVAVVRRDTQLHARQADLPAMGVAGEGQRDPRRHAGEDVRLVREQDGRRVVREAASVAGRSSIPRQRPRPPPKAHMLPRPASQKSRPSLRRRTALFSSTGMPAASSARSVSGRRLRLEPEAAGSSHQSWLPSTAWRP